MPTETIRRGTLRWRGVVKMDGAIQKTKWFDSGPKEQRKAILWEEETRKALRAQPKTPTALLEPLKWANDYLNDVERRHSKKTYVEKRSGLLRFLRFAHGKSLHEYTPALALAFFQEQHDKRSGNAANKDRKNLATAWKWGQKYLDRFPDKPNPFMAVDRFPEQRQDRYIPPEEDFHKVFELTEGQDRIMLTAFLHLGARRGEVFRLTWADVDFKENCVWLTTRKTLDGSPKTEDVPMSSELRAALLWWWENRPYKQAENVFTCLDDSPSPNHNPGGPFLYRQHFMKKLCKRAGVKPFGFHAIRHLSASMLYRAGYKVDQIQMILRHEKATTTDRYLRSLGSRREAMREAVETFSKRGPAKVLTFVRKSETPEAGTSGVSSI
ncbi:MAG: site-specific integrase [Desulfocurvibacter africanus]